MDRQGSGKPLIGVLPWAQEVCSGREPGYIVQAGVVDALRVCGAAVVMLGFSDDPGDIGRYADMCDGFLFPGGGDIDPTIYGRDRLEACGPACFPRDGMELALASLAIARDKPVLGICRGCQVLNVALGGTLWQDIPSQLDGPDGGGRIAHVQQPPFTEPSHPVSTVPGTLLARVYGGAGTLMVNSTHHQAVDGLGAGLVVGAYAPDGVVESVEEPSRRFVLGVQWHPERLWEGHPEHIAPFRALVDACW